MIQLCISYCRCYLFTSSKQKAEIFRLFGLKRLHGEFHPGQTGYAGGDNVNWYLDKSGQSAFHVTAMLKMMLKIFTLPGNPCNQHRKLDKNENLDLSLYNGLFSDRLFIFATDTHHFLVFRHIVLVTNV